jgi:hypothetical protein
VVVDNDDSRQQLCDLYLRSWNYTLLHPYVGRDKAVRSHEDKRLGRLPLPAFERSIPGRPQYMVGLIYMPAAPLSSLIIVFEMGSTAGKHDSAGPQIRAPARHHLLPNLPTSHPYRHTFGGSCLARLACEE